MCITCSINHDLLEQMTESAYALKKQDWDAFVRYGIFCARWQGILLFPAMPYMINLDVKLLTPGLQLWLDATDPLANGTILTNGTAITTWYDKSGNLNNATGGVSPIYANNSIVFNRKSFLDTTISARPMYETIFVVFLTAAPLTDSFYMVGTSSNAGRGLRISNNNIGYNVSGVSGYSNTNGGVVRAVTTMASGTISGGPINGVGTTFINGGSYISQSQVFTTYGEGNTRIGAGDGSDFFDGTINEILIYNRALSTTERQRVEGYLAWKWRLNNSLPTTHLYYNSFDVVIQEIEALTNLPTFIVGVNQTNASPETFTVSWSGGDNSTYYTYIVDGVELQPSDDQGLPQKYATFSGFSAGTLHSVIITAFNSAGSRYSATFQAGTTASRPYSLSLTSPLSNEFTINWLGGTNGLIGSSYSYTLNEINTVPVSSTFNSARFTGLEEGTIYRVVVYANNQYGSISSDVFNATTRPAKPVSLTITSATPSNTTIIWSGAKGATSFSYTLNGDPVVAASSTPTSVTFNNLIPGNLYTLIVISINSIIPYATNSSLPITITTAPSQPISLIASNISTSGFTVNWLGGASSTSYIYKLNNSVVSPSNINDQGVASKYVVFSNLSAGTQYTVSITAENIAGPSIASANLIVYTAPTAPTSLIITEITLSGFKVSWSGSTGATAYSYQLNGKQVTPSNDKGVTDKYAVFSGLLPGTIYNIVVIASNPSGFSISSNIVSSISGLQLWLDGANPLGNGILPSNASAVPTWYDLSTNIYNATGINSPTYTNSGISFNGSSQYYTTNYTSSASTETIFVVFKLNSLVSSSLVDTSLNGGRSFRSDSSNGPSLLNSLTTKRLNGLYPISANTTYVAEALYNSSGNSIYITGNVSSSNVINLGFTTGVTYIGAGNNSGSVGLYMDGIISEVIIFNSVLSTLNRQIVEGYLAWKWGLQNTLPVEHPYYAASPASAVSITTAPSQPSFDSLINGSLTGFTIKWTGGSGASSYTYKISQTTTPLVFVSVTPSIDLGVTNKLATFTGLTPGTSYQIIINANNTNGSTPSANITAITSPSKPISLTSSNIIDTSFTVNWLGGQGATSYIYKLNGLTTGFTVNDQGVASRTATFSGLTANRSYEVIVIAVNSTGQTAYGDQFNPTSVSGIQSWLDATDPRGNGSTVTNGLSLTDTSGNVTNTWYDKSRSVNKRNMTFTSSIATYSTSSVNSNNTIYANGSTIAKITIPVNTFTNNYCGFAVIRNIDFTPVALFSRDVANWATPFTLTNQRIGGDWYCGTGYANRTDLGAYTEQVVQAIGNNLVEVLLTTYNATGNTGTFNAYINGAPITLTGGQVTNLNAADGGVDFVSFAALGGGPTNLRTDFCEIIMYNSNISVSNRQKIEGYLAWKWGLQNKPLYSPVTYLNLITNAINTGTAVQTVTNNNVVFGRNNFKESARFNNSTSTYLSMPFSYGTGSFTISYWFNANDTTRYNPWSLSSSATGTSYGINPDIINGIQSCNMAFSGGTLSLPTFTYSPASGRWYHFALTVNVATGFCQMYANGVAKTSGTGSGTLNNSAYLIIGKAGDNARAFNGAINNFAVYNSELASTQILDIYNSQVVTNPLPASHPYYSEPVILGLTVVTTPIVPSGFTLSDATFTEFTLTWANGTAAYDYAFTIDNAPVVPLFTPNSARFTGLSAGTSYSVVVIAKNEAGVAAPSSPYLARTTPSKPISLNIVNLSDTGFTVNWLGGLGATSYIYKLDGLTTGFTLTDQGLSSKTAIFSGLTPNRSYELVIIAVNVSGETSSANPMTPSLVSGLQCWLDGNDPLNTGLAGTNNGTLTTWIDKSGNSRNMIWTGSSITYANSSINSLNTIYANGLVLQGTITIPIGRFSSNYCGFIVMRTNKSGFPQTIFGRTDTNGYGLYDNYGDTLYIGQENASSSSRTEIGTSTSVFTTYVGVPMMKDFGLTNYNKTGGTGAYSQYHNGLLVSFPLPVSGLNAADTDADAANIYFGGRAGNSQEQQSNYCEILIYNSNISISDRQKLQGYLAWKWGLQSVRPYIAQTVLLLSGNTLDTGSNSQTVTNSGVSVINLLTNISKKSSANFTGTNYLTLPFNYGENSFSITYWSYCSSTIAMTAWSLSSTASGASGAAGINADVATGTQHFYLTFSGGIVNAGNWSAPATSGVWYQSILTVNAITGECNSYLNGVLKNTVSGIGSLQNTANLLVGRNATNTKGFTGFINNFAVYNYALSQTQITAIYNSESIVNLLPLSHPYYSSPPLIPLSIRTLPPKPILSQNFTNITTTSFTVNWSGTTGVTIFTYMLNGDAVSASSSTSTSATFTALQAGTPYTISVIAYNEDGYFIDSDPLTGSTAPSQPTGFSATSISRTAFTLSWTGGTGATSYTYTLTSLSVTNPVIPEQVLLNKTAVFTGLTGGRTYGVVVTAISSYGSTSSALFNVLTSPEPPVILQATNILSNGFVVNWSGASGATSYTYTLDGVTAVPVSSTSTSARFTDLSAGTSYALIVTAKNSSGDTPSVPNAYSSILTLPGKPFNLTSTNASTSGFTINWNGGDGATSYTYTFNGLTTGFTLNDQGVASKSAVITNLASGTDYAVVVTAVNSSGSNSSAPGPLTTPAMYLWIDGNDPLGTGILPANNSTVLTLNDKSGNSRNLSSTNTSSAARYYTNSLNGLGSLIFSNSGYRRTLTGILYPFDVYIIFKQNSITATSYLASVSETGTANSFNSLGISAETTKRWSNGSNSSSRNVISSVDEVSTDYMLIRWSIGNNNFVIHRNGSQIALSASYSWTSPASIAFLLGLRTDNTTIGTIAGNIAEIVVYASQLSDANRELVEGILAHKWGIQSSLVKSGGHPYLVNPPPGVSLNTAPTAPVITSQTSGSTTGFTINWTDAVGATSFTYTFDGTPKLADSNTSTSATFSGLQAGTSYAVVVTAFKRTSGASSASFTAITAPTNPYDLVFSAITSTGFTLSWSGSNTATSYSFTNNGTPITASSTDVANKTAIFTGLPSGTEYSIFVVATNLAGSTPGQNNPSAIAGLQLWLDGADPNATGVTPSLGSTLTSWKDKTSNNNHYTLTNATYSYDSVYARNAVLFSGTGSGGLQANSALSPFANTNLWTIFSVHRGTNSANSVQTVWRSMPVGISVWLRYNGGSSVQFPNSVNIENNSVTYNGFSGVWSVVSSASTAIASFNGTASTPLNITNSGLNSSSRITIASYDTNGEVLAGYIDEILVFNTNVSVSDRQKIEGYLARKWNIISLLPVSHPYYASTPGNLTRTIGTLPSPITALSSSEITMSSFKVSWSGGVGATSYTYSLDGVTTVPSTNSGVASKFAIFTGLSSGRTYAVVVIGANSIGATISSSSFDIVMPPSAPFNLSYSAVTSTGFTISWSGGNGATSYSYRNYDNTNITTSVVTDVVAKTAIFTGLSSGTEYNIIVVATNSSASTIGGNQFNPSKISVLQNWYDAADPLATGSAPANGTTIATWFDKSGNARNSISVGGNAITINNDGYNFLNFTVSNYVIPTMTWMVNSGFTLFMVETTNTFNSSTGGLSYFGSSLGHTNGAPTYYAGNATNQYFGTVNGQGANVTTSNPGLLTGVTRVWSFVFNDATNVCIVYLDGILMATSVTTSKATKGVNMIGGIGAYTVHYNGKMREFIGFSGTMTTTFRQYMEGYLAWKWGRQSTLPLVHPSYTVAPVGPLTIVTTPSPITDLSSSEISLSSFKVSWSGGFGATSYTYTLDTVTTVPSTNSGVASKFAIFTGLSPGRTYSVVVIAANSIGVTTSSSSFDILMPPSRPFNQVYSNVTETGFTLSWSGGLGATSYTYSNGLDTTTGVTITTPVVTDLANRTATFTELENGTEYNILITAINTAGSAPHISPFSPSVLSGLQLWLDANDPLANGTVPADGLSLRNAGGTVTNTWYGKVGTSRNLVFNIANGAANANSTGPSGITYSNNSVNSLNSIRLNAQAAAGTVSIPAGTFSSNYVAFIIYRVIDTKMTTVCGRTPANAIGLFDNFSMSRFIQTPSQVNLGIGTDIYNLYNNTVLLMNFSLTGYSASGGAGVYNEYLNGSKVTMSGGTQTGLNGTDVSDNLVIGGARGGNTDAVYGNFCEVLIYNTNIVTANREIIEGYLAGKWGLRGSLPSGHKYKTIEPIVPIQINTVPYDYTYQILATGIPTTGTRSLHTSLDNGQTWMSIKDTIPNTSYTYTRTKAIGWNGTYFVGGFLKGTKYTIAYSTNGLSWTDGGYNLITDFKNIAYNNRWIAATTNPNCITTTGATPTGWVDTDTGLDNYLSNIVWAGTKWIGMGSGTGNKRMITSTTGNAGSWTVFRSGLANNSTFMKFSNNRLLVCYSGTPILEYSNDNGTTFTTSTSAASVFTTSMNCVAWNGSMWVGVGTGTNTLGYSSDGITWTGLGTSIFSTSGNTVVWTGSTWIAGGSGTNSLAYSTNGTTWTGSGTTLFSSVTHLTSRTLI